MPKLFNMSVWVIGLASVVMFLCGIIWYEVVFGDAWINLTQTQDIAAFDVEQSQIVGFFLYAMQGVAITYGLRNTANPTVFDGLKVGFFLWLFIALPLSSYSWNYAGGAFQLLALDAGCLLLAYSLGGAILGAFKKTSS